MGWIEGHFRKFASAESAQKALERYRMGIKAGGAIRGVRVSVAADGCPACQHYADRVFALDEAPALPIAECVHGKQCQCTYRPAMTYEDER